MMSECEIICRLCGSQELEFMQPCRPFTNLCPEGFSQPAPPHSCGSLYRCMNCHVALREPCLTLDELGDLYTEMPEKGLKNYTFESNSAWVEARKMIAGSSTVLDVGCNLGGFLTGLDSTIKKFGVEPSVFSVERCHQQGIEIIADFVEDVSEQWFESFDAVCLFDVFEHLPNPIPAMERALQCLKPGGSLFLSTGNFDHWVWQWTGSHNWYMDTPQHMTLGGHEFFKWFSQHSETACHLQRVKTISHRAGKGTFLGDTAAAFHWGCMLRGGGWRIPQRAMQLCPWWSRFTHRQAPPYTAALRDHLVIQLIKGEEHE